MAAPPQAPATGARGRNGSHGVERWFYINVALLIILLCAISFGPSIIDQSRRNAPTLLVTTHSIVLIAWLVLFLTQAALVATGRRSIHRFLGLLGPVLAVTVIILSYLVLINFGRRGYRCGVLFCCSLGKLCSPLWFYRPPRGASCRRG
jgi:hypothetical protein